MAREREDVSDREGKTRPPVRVERVEGRRAVNRFIRLPWAIYAEDPAWVPPLLVERRDHLSTKNPYFQHARYRAWLAYRGPQPVGRISAQVDELHLQRYRDDTGFFGMLESVDDAESFEALTSAAESWLRDQGMRRVRGPFSLSINDECGLLVDGFHTPPYIMMGHARPYYAEHMMALGFRKAKDVLAYRVASDFPSSKVLPSLLSRAGGSVHLRPVRRAQFNEDLRILQDIFEDAWSENWGFVPFTSAEFHRLGQNLRLFVDLNLAQIAEVDGEPAAMMVAFPNLNEVIRDLNGRLFPLGWAKLLWRLKVRYPKSARVPLMGVRKRYQRSVLGAALALMLIEAVRDPGVKLGIREVELSWILEDNRGVQRVIESIGGTAYKRYRIYEKEMS